jgi:hypothetical protein
MQSRVCAQGRMQVSDVAKARDRLGARPNGVEVDVIGEAVGAGTASGDDHRLHRRVAECLVQVCEAFGVPAGHAAPAGEGVLADFRDEPPSLEDPYGFLDPFWFRVAGS